MGESLHDPCVLPERGAEVTVHAGSIPQPREPWGQQEVSYRGTRAKRMANGTRFLFPFSGRTEFQHFSRWHCSLFVWPAFDIVAQTLCPDVVHSQAPVRSSGGSELITCGKSSTVGRDC